MYWQCVVIPASVHAIQVCVGCLSFTVVLINVGLSRLIVSVHIYQSIFYCVFVATANMLQLSKSEC